MKWCGEIPLCPHRGKPKKNCEHSVEDFDGYSYLDGLPIRLYFPGKGCRVAPPGHEIDIRDWLMKRVRELEQRRKKAVEKLMALYGRARVQKQEVEEIVNLLRGDK